MLTVTNLRLVERRTAAPANASAVYFHNPRTNKAPWVLTETADKLRAMTDSELRAYRFGPVCAAFRNIRLATDIELQRRERLAA